MQYADAMFAALASAVILAAISAPHCAAMCGPLATCASSGRRRGAAHYHLGRIIGYAAAGGIAGGVGHAAATLISPWLMAGVAWLAALALLIVAARAWRWTDRVALVRLVPRGRGPLSRLARWIRHRPGVAGCASALLPCGVLWAALALALSSGTIVGGVVVMSAFAILSAVSVSVAAALLRAIRRRAGAKPFAVVLAISAILFILLPLPRLVADADSDADVPACPLHANHSEAR